MHQSALVLAALLLTGCTTMPTGPGVAAPDKNVHVYVSNQSFEQPTANIRVTIDGEVLFDQEAHVENQHNWMLRETTLAAGTHTVTAREANSGAQDEFTFNLPEGERRWLVVDFWNDGEARFTITLHQQQVAFD